MENYVTYLALSTNVRSLSLIKLSESEAVNKGFALLLRMTDNMIYQNIDISSSDTL